jgi:RNA polymerase-binding protein DksA
VTVLDVDHFRETLLEERNRILAAIEYLHEESPGSADEAALETWIDDHLAENASVTLDREIDSTLEENSEHVLSEIESALARIDAGTFGKCVTCGRQIAAERLEALPYTSHCIDCKRKEGRG